MGRSAGILSHATADASADAVVAAFLGNALGLTTMPAVSETLLEQRLAASPYLAFELNSHAFGASLAACSAAGGGCSLEVATGRLLAHLERALVQAKADLQG